MSVVELSAVVPVYRNAATVEELARRLHATLEASVAGHELIFVDDACPEGSLGVLRRMADADPRVAVLALSRNVGQHAAVMVGLAHARGAWTVILDADLQDPPEAVPRLLAAAEEGTAAVFAGRCGAYESPGRLLTSRLFKRMLHRVAGVPSDAGIFVALRRPARERLLELSTGRPFVVAMIGALGLPMRSVPVERSPRSTGASAYSTWGRLRSAAAAFGCVYDCRRPRPGLGALWQPPYDVVKERHGARFAAP